MKMKQTGHPFYEKSFFKVKDPIRYIKKSLFIPTLKCQHPAQLSLDTMKLCVRHSCFRKIEFGNFLSQPGARRILKRNLKYIRGTRYCHFTRSPSFYTWKFAYDIEDKAFQERNFFGDSIIPLSPPSFNAKGWAQSLRILAKNNITAKVLQIGMDILSNLPQRKWSIRKLQSFGRVKLLEEHNSASFSPKILCNINKIFVHLQILSLELRNPSTPKILHDTFEILGNITQLTSITVNLILIAENNTEPSSPRPFGDQFENLKHLHFQIRLLGGIKETGNTFRNFGQFNSINSLNFELYTTSNLNHLDAIKFAVAHVQLETFKFSVQQMQQSEYDQLFEGIKNMEFLAHLRLLQKDRIFSAFGYGKLFETIEALKKLKSFKLDLGYQAFDFYDMVAIFKHFLKHPSLKNVDLLMRISKFKECYQFGDEFYGNLEKLKHKLNCFKLFLILSEQFPVEVPEQIEKILLPKGVADRHFSFKSFYL